VHLLNSGGDTSVALLLQQTQHALKQGQQALEWSKAVTEGLAANDTSHREPPHDSMQARIPSALSTPQAQPSVLASGDNAKRTNQRWEDIEIRFLSDERVHIFTDGKPGNTMNFAEMGFEDRRGEGGKPTQAWQLLKALSRKDGIFPATGISGQQGIQKRAQKIRHVLCHHFSITENPFPFVEGTGYKTRFKITRSPACQT
jgi:hypothetical protein